MKLKIVVNNGSTAFKMFDKNYKVNLNNPPENIYETIPGWKQDRQDLIISGQGCNSPPIHQNNS
jgi:hypothetical protein